MRSLLSPLLLSAGVVLGAAALQPTPAAAVPLPVTSARALAGDGAVEQVHYRRHRHFRRHAHYGPRFYRYRRVYARRYYDPAGAAFAGAALGLVGGALAAATAPTYYYPSYYSYPAYYPAYYGGWGYPGWGYRRAYYWGGGWGHPGWAYRRAYWGGGWGWR